MSRVEAVGDCSLYLVYLTIEARMVFGESTATGTLVRPDEAPVPMALEWKWVDRVYCRTGTIGEIPTDRQCEAVLHYPGVGVELDYLTSDEPNEFWVFDPA